jgi:competence protein ComEA
LVLAASMFVAFTLRAGTVGRPPELVLPAVGSDGDPDRGDPAPAGDHRDTGTIAVHAAGAFVRPGLYEMPAGARVAQLVDAAGGAAPGALLDALNLAARLTDGDRIFLPGGPTAVDPLNAGPAANTVAGPAGARPQVVDLNTATLEQLDALPGIGPSTAQAILDHRRTHGRFRSIDELLEVRGIGDAKLAAIRDLVRA